MVGRWIASWASLLYYVLLYCCKRVGGSVCCCGVLLSFGHGFVGLFILFFLPLYRPRAGIVQRSTIRWVGGWVRGCHCCTIHTYCCTAVVQGGGWVDRFVPAVCCGVCPRVRGLFSFSSFFLLFRPRAGIVQRTTININSYKLLVRYIITFAI